MSNSCKSTVTGRAFATAFFGGLSRGKIIQLHMDRIAMQTLLFAQVEDETSGVVELFSEWLKGECANASMILFDNGLAEPKCPTPILIERN